MKSVFAFALLAVAVVSQSVVSRVAVVPRGVENVEHVAGVVELPMSAVAVNV